MENRELYNLFHKKSSREIRDIIKYQKNEFSDEALECMRKILIKRYNLNDIATLSEIDELIEQEIQRQINAQLVQCLICGCGNPNNRVAMYAIRKCGKRIYSLSSVLPGILVSAITIPTLGVGGLDIHSQQKYDVYSFDVIICNDCIKQYGASSSIAEEHSVLANRLLEFGFSIIDKKEYESFFSKDAQ